MTEHEQGPLSVVDLTDSWPDSVVTEHEVCPRHGEPYEDGGCYSCTAELWHDGGGAAMSAIQPGVSWCGRSRCEPCGGSGRAPNSKPCWACDGTGDPDGFDRCAHSWSQVGDREYRCWKCGAEEPDDSEGEGQRFVGTHLSVAEHQRLTVENYLELRTLDSALPFIPVLQGFTLSEYLRCADLYEQAGVDLAAEQLVGVGSVCRRQATGEIAMITRQFSGLGFSLHGFGVKTLGLARYSRYLRSSDSMAWSLDGRYSPGCAPSHRSEANCMRYALAWRQRLLEGPPVDPSRPTLWEAS